MMITHAIRPDMSRNMALAGMTVSTKGMNVTYDERGYAVRAVNYNHRIFVETSKSIRAPSKEAVLAGDSRTGYDGPDEDRTHFSDGEFARAVELRRQVAEGTLSEREANDQLEEIRRMYGYSLGVSGNQYAEILLPEERPEEVAKARRASAAAQETPVMTQETPAAAEAVSVQSAAPQQQDTPNGVEALRNSFQTQLLEQQQSQTIRGELEELRVRNLIRVNGDEIVSDALLGLTDEDEDG